MHITEREINAGMLVLIIHHAVLKKKVQHLTEYCI